MGFLPSPLSLTVAAFLSLPENLRSSTVELSEMAEGVGFEPTVELPLLLISSQMPLTTQPPFQRGIFFAWLRAHRKLIHSRNSEPCNVFTSFLRGRTTLPILQRAE